MQPAPALTNEALFAQLHPRLADCFRATYGKFTQAQLRCVPSILDHRSILLTSPTGSGKTLAGFLGIFDFLLRHKDAGKLTPTVYCIYVSPLRALAYDIQKNLQTPIASMGLEKEFTVHLRSGDTKPADRAKFQRRPAHFLLTTPESLAVMLAQERNLAHFATCRFVIVDELHAFAGNKRGADLAISLERLEPVVRRPNDKAAFCRVGLSATAAPLETLARFLVGENRACRIAEAPPEKEAIVEVFSPIRRNPYPPAGYTGVRLYAELAQLIRSRESVLVFTNVRSAAEQIGLRLKELLPDLARQIETHHGSLDRSVRLQVEDRLKSGALRAVVCSTSLEMGIDIGAVDLVVMVATPKGVARAIQRIGRSGHSLNRTSHGVLVGTNINDLVEATVTAKLVRQRTLDPIKLQNKPYDVVAQHVVGLAALGPIEAEEVFALVRRAYPFRNLERAEFERIVRYLAGGGVSLEKHYTELFGKIRVEGGVISLAYPRIAREFLVNVGTIHAEGFVDVILGRRRLGSVEENFIKQLNIGDLFVLGGRIVRLLETGVQQAFVERADGQLPTVPRWNAAKMPLTSGIAAQVRRLRTELARRLEEAEEDEQEQKGRETLDWLVEEYHLTIANAQAIVEQFRAQMRISEVPVGRKLLIELYRDDKFSHYFFHSLIGRSANDALSRIVAVRVKNRIGGNALVTIDDYGFLLPLEEWRACFQRENAEMDLHAALRGVGTGEVAVSWRGANRSDGAAQLAWAAATLEADALERGKCCSACSNNMSPSIRCWKKRTGRRSTLFSMWMPPTNGWRKRRSSNGSCANCRWSCRFPSRSTQA